MIEIYRLYLFLGMVIHKAVWEILKRRNGTHPTKKSEPQPAIKTVVKYIKIAFLFFLIVQTLFLPVILPIAASPFILRWIGIFTYTAGLVIAIIGRVQLGTNWANIEDYQVLSEQRLVKKGIYGLIRHPIYTGDLLLIFGLEMALNSWLVLLVIPLAFLIFKQAKSEEKILSSAFDGYAAYQQTTKMFVPFIY